MRRSIFVASTAAVWLATLVRPVPWIGEDWSRCALAVEVADLQQQLENELRARLPSEFAFIARIVRMVEMDQLPLSLVRSTFHWARGKRPYPYQYFHRGIIVRARRIGIEIPPASSAI
jgi:hypothetical protein